MTDLEYRFIVNLFDKSEDDFLIPFDVIKQLAKLKEEAFEFTQKENSRISVSYDGIEIMSYTPSMKLEDYPNIADIFKGKPEQIIHIPAVVTGYIRTAAGFTAKDDTRRALFSVMLNSEHIMATNGKWLYYAEHGIKGINDNPDKYGRGGFLIPAEKKEKLYAHDMTLQHYGKNPGTNSNLLSLQSDNIVMQYKNDNNYPSYRYVIPTSFSQSGKIKNVEKVLDIINPKDTGFITVEFIDDKTCTIIPVIFTASYLAHILKLGFRSVKYNNALSPVVFVKGSENIVIMPVREKK